MATNDYFIKDNSSNLYLADTEKIKADTERNYKDNFGADLVTGNGGLASVLIAMETKLKTDTIDAIAYCQNQINPQFASGLGLDSLCAFTDTKRRLATATRVLAKLKGVAGSEISANSRASKSDGTIFYLESQTTLDANGEADAVFVCSVEGAIPCAIGELNTIIDENLGWETIINEVAGVVGLAEENDASLENRRVLELYKNAKAIPESVKSAIFSLSEVSSLYFAENKTRNAIVYDEINLVPNSIYLCVDGGNDDDIVKTLYAQKTSGADYNNGASANPKEVQIIFIDEFNDKVHYTAKFDRPDIVPIKIKVKVKILGSTNPPIAEIQQDILNYANSPIYGEGFKIFRDVSPFEIISKVAQNQKYFISDCEIATLSDEIYSRETIQIKAWEKAMTSDNLIQVDFI